MPESLGDLVKLYRKRAGFTQEQLAQKVGVDDSYVSMIETGARGGPRTSRDVILALAQVLGAPPARLLRAAGREAPKADRERLDFRTFIDTEPTLTGEQREILLALYESWGAG